MSEQIAVADMLPLLAYMGDMSMGQPFGHSMRVSRLVERLAATLDLDAATTRDARQVALLRWVGCTANASEIAEVMDDDVAGRHAMLALRPADMGLRVPASDMAAHASNLSHIHCEVSAVITAALGLSPGVTDAIQCLFERWDGQGHPRGLAGDQLPLPTQLAVLAGDLEILQREYGLTQALTLLETRADVVYPRTLVTIVRAHAATWLDDQALASTADTTPLAEPAHRVDLTLLADTIELKLPWLTGYSRTVAEVARKLGAGLGLPADIQAALGRAALLHSLGRVAVPNHVWNQAGRLSARDWESVRLGPYWTARAAALTPALATEVDLASHAYERLDGSGYFRSAREATMPAPYRVLPVACAWVALRRERPWRAAMDDAAALAQLQADSTAGRLDAATVALLGHAQWANYAPVATPAEPAPSLLSTREREVLQAISHGHSNKEAARLLGLSPSTVRTHMESIFRKLACNSRAAATLKASMLGLLAAR